MRIDGNGKDILSYLLETYPEFRLFYKEEFEKKLGSIGWIEDHDIPKNMEAYYHAGECAIHYRTSPVSIADDYVMAHEKMHAIRIKENNLAKVGCRDLRYEVLGTSLNSLLEDQNVDSILQNQYKIDLLTYYKENINYVEEHAKRESMDQISRINSGLILANSILKWDLITDQEALKAWHNHLMWFEKQYPNIYKIGRRVALIVKQKGVSKVENHRAIVNKLIDKYKLGSILVIK